MPLSLLLEAQLWFLLAFIQLLYQHSTKSGNKNYTYAASGVTTLMKETIWEN
jgi:hypothetical protein